VKPSPLFGSAYPILRLFASTSVLSPLLENNATADAPTIGSGHYEQTSLNFTITAMSKETGSAPSLCNRTANGF